MLNGALLAVDEVNADAAFGVQVDPVVADPGGELGRYAPLCTELLNAGIRHVIGCYTSSSRKEIIPIVEKRDALLWYPSHYEGFETSANVVYTGAVPSQHILPLIGYVLQRSSPRVFCVGSNYIWAWENNRILREAMLVHGGSVVGERCVPVGEVDLDGVVQAILAARPGFVFSTLIGDSAYRFFSLFRAACTAQGINQAQAMPVISCSLSEPELMEIDPEARDGHISASVYFSSVRRPESARFVAAYDRRFPSGPAASADAEASYIAVKLLASALRAAETDAAQAVLHAAARQVLQAPQGEVRLDKDNMHAFLTPRIGRSRRDGCFDILHEAAVPVRPDPYLVHSTPRFGLPPAPRLRVVS